MSSGPMCHCGHPALDHAPKGPGERACSKCDCTDWTGKRTWLLDDALVFVRALELHLAPNYHVALTGSVLFVGHSRKDLDILIYPHRTPTNDYAEVRKILESFDMSLTVDHEAVLRKWSKWNASSDTKHIELWDYKGKRVDVFQPYTP